MKQIKVTSSTICMIAIEDIYRPIRQEPLSVDAAMCYLSSRRLYMKMYKILGLLGLALLLGCSSSSTTAPKNVVTDYKINLAGVGSFDSVTAVYTVDDSDTTRETLLPTAVDSSGNIQLAISAPKNSKISLNTLVWKDGKILSSGADSLNGGSKIKIATAVLNPSITISAPSVCYLDLTHCNLVSRAISRTGTAETQLKQIALDLNNDGTFDTIVSGGILGKDSLSIALVSVPNLIASTTQVIVLRVTEVSGRIFYDTVKVQVQTSAGSITDSRDGQVYSYRQIGSQVWMTQNLNYNPTGIYDSSWCYANDTANCSKYGRLYNWQTAMAGSTIERSEGICPVGWHVPTQTEFTRLTSYADTNDNLLVDWSSGASLKAATTWSSGNGRDIFGFGALAAGYYSDAAFYNQTNITIFWSSTRASSPWVWYDEFASYWTGSFGGNHPMDDGYSVRCIQDTTPAQ